MIRHCSSDYTVQFVSKYIFWSRHRASEVIVIVIVRIMPQKVVGAPLSWTVACINRQVTFLVYSLIPIPPGSNIPNFDRFTTMGRTGSCFTDLATAPSLGRTTLTATGTPAWRCTRAPTARLCWTLSRTTNVSCGYWCFLYSSRRNRGFSSASKRERTREGRKIRVYCQKKEGWFCTCCCCCYWLPVPAEGFWEQQPWVVVAVVSFYPGITLEAISRQEIRQRKLPGRKEDTRVLQEETRFHDCHCCYCFGYFVCHIAYSNARSCTKHTGTQLLEVKTLFFLIYFRRHAPLPGNIRNVWTGSMV